MDSVTLQNRIDQAETALHALLTGAREQEIVGADGERVSYTAVTMPQLQAYLAYLRAKQADAYRRPIYFQF
jgi:hypothetical protein